MFGLALNPKFFFEPFRLLAQDKLARIYNFSDGLEQFGFNLPMLQGQINIRDTWGHG